MPRKAPIQIPPAGVDLAIARAVAAEAKPPVERALKVATFLADERTLIAGTAAFWLYARLVSRNRRLELHADDLMLCAVASAALPHLIKKVVDRERPDRRVPTSRRRRRSIPRSGKPFDSFPSGHAMHLGAIAAATAPLVGPRLRPVIWSGAAALAFTRVALLAHYATDVVSGLVLGAALAPAVRRLCGSKTRAA